MLDQVHALPRRQRAQNFYRHAPRNLYGMGYHLYLMTLVRRSSFIRPLGKTADTQCNIRSIDPVDMDGTASRSFSPMRITVPLPTAFN